ncbi:hypothetical protein [Ralstonia flaminis]|jgi:hypothetical protein|uniref:Uncharacterized protein n=1 Tax=Ralstonia flaminis TaxID=3058597 RepID=A0ABN9JTZ9_9RALS|nr:hypothetical protein [Ralstonia sp. LMG 18101]CAJ0821105.1 hypothetical protein LMG18101_04511 [Ralstonia sp. LMG 18101]
MAIRFQRVLPLAASAALAALLASGTAVAAQDHHDACCDPQVKSMAAPLAKAGPRDPYTDGAKSGARDPYTDGAAAQAMLEACIGPRDPYTDGGLTDTRGPRERNPYTDGARV